MFRDDIPRCPTCDGPFEQLGDRHVCSGCAAVLIAAARLNALLVQCAPDDERPLEQRVFPRTGMGRSCPLCRSPMTPGRIHESTFEQCNVHGVFIAKDALQQLFATHGTLYADRDADRTPLSFLAAIPILNIVGAGANTALVGWAKRRRLRKYITRTTPPSAH